MFSIELAKCIASTVRPAAHVDHEQDKLGLEEVDKVCETGAKRDKDLAEDFQQHAEAGQHESLVDELLGFQGVG